MCSKSVCCKVVLAVGLVIFFLTNLFMIVLTYFESSLQADSTCSTKECVVSAARILASMDESVSPCDDFYRYACGGWIDKHPISDHARRVDQFSLLSGVTDDKIKDILEGNNSLSAPLPLRQARQMYRDCMDQEELEKKGETPILEVLDSLGLPFDDKKKRFSWQQSVAMAEKTLGDSFLFTLDVVPNPRKNTKFVLEIRSSELLQYKNERHDEAVEDSIGDFADLLNRHVGGTKLDAKANAGIIGLFHEKLKHLPKKWDFTADPNTQFHEMSLEDLQEVTESYTNNIVQQFDWAGYLNDVLLGRNASRPIIVRNKPYFKRWARLLQRTDPDTIKMYLQWRAFVALAPYVREKRFPRRSVEPRWKVCKEIVNDAFEMSLGLEFFNRHLTTSDLSMVNLMVENILISLSNMTSNGRVAILDWMDSEDKTGSNDKLKTTLKFIGIPKSLLERSETQEKIDLEEGNLFQTHLIHLAALKASKLRLLSLEPVKRVASFNGNPTSTKIQYRPETNSITIPSGALQPPFINAGDEAVEYGTLGALIGHQLAHSFDNIGRHYNSEGDLLEKWTQETLASYTYFTKCINFVQEQPGLADDSEAQVENYADALGLLAAIGAYHYHGEYWLNSPSKLPGFAHLTNRHVFYISYAQMWCSNGDAENGARPDRSRVLSATLNTPGFNIAWKCQPDGSYLNNRCDQFYFY